jgi:hypothetical protein
MAYLNVALSSNCARNSFCAKEATADMRRGGHCRLEGFPRQRRFSSRSLNLATEELTSIPCAAVGHHITIAQSKGGISGCHTVEIAVW